MVKALSICATHGRHQCLERTVGMFLNQDYPDKVLFIHNNSPVELELSENFGNIILLNKSKNDDGSEYSSLGNIYTDTFKVIDEIRINPDLVSFMDDDDLYLPDHISEGVKGYLSAYLLGKIAYKPKQSYYRHGEGLTRMENTLEPSIFVEYQHIKKYGFSDTTTEQHLQWVNPLVEEDKILVVEGASTLIYNWGADYPTFKTSGDCHNPNNFRNYRAFSTDNGDEIITPWDKGKVNTFLTKIVNKT